MIYRVINTITIRITFEILIIQQVSQTLTTLLQFLLSYDQQSKDIFVEKSLVRSCCSISFTNATPTKYINEKRWGSARSESHNRRTCSNGISLEYSVVNQRIAKNWGSIERDC